MSPNMECHLGVGVIVDVFGLGQKS
jgi:hypothetical protein